jgi:hypothetical protein
VSLPEPQPEPVEIPPSVQQSSIPEAEQPSAVSAEEQPVLEGLEDQSQTITTDVSKPKRSRQSARSQKITEDIQTPVEAIDNSVGTNQSSDTLEQ